MANAAGNILGLTTEEIWARVRGVPERDLALFARQLSVLIAASLPAVRALEISAAQTEHPYLKRLLEEVAEEVADGASISASLENYPRTFSPFYIHLIRSGESSGRLAEVLEYLADEAEKSFDLHTKIRGAFAYPAFIVSGMIAVGFVMMIFVVPKLTDVLKETGGKLPFATRALIFVSDITAHYWWAILLFAAVVIVAGVAWASQPSGRRAFDGIKLRLPIFGGLFRRIAVVRFARSMATLLAGGVEVPDALKTASEVAGNAAFRDLVLDAESRVRDGHPLAEAFAESSLVPPMLPALLSVGEETGRIKEILGRLAAFYSREIDNLVANLVHLIEPIVMVALGIGVGLMVAAVILPMYNLASQF